jgi:hypothetical protein
MKFSFRTATLPAIFAALSIGPGVTIALAQSAPVGAPTSAAGGTSQTLTPPSTVLPPAAGPLGSSSPGGAGASSSGSSTGSIRDLTPGTGKFEQPNVPCNGTTGFGSSNAQPGHKC